MAQEMKIPVSANTDGVVAGIDNIKRAGKGAAAATAEIGKEARAAAKEYERLQDQARKLESVRRMYAGHGVNLSDQDAATAAANFSRMGRRGVGARFIGAFDTAEGWEAGHAAAFTKAAHAKHHHQFTLARGLEGTSAAGALMPPGPPEGGGGGGGGAAAGGMAAGAGRMAMRFAPQLLALAGITSVAAMASQAVRSATNEGESVDAAKRRLGDLGVDFGALRYQSRRAGGRYGVNAERTAGYMAQYVRSAGRLRGADGVGAALDTGFGLSRAYGMDLGEGVDFFGGMRRSRVTNNDQQDRKLALLIADAIEKGGFVGAAEEVLQAVQGFTAQATRMSLSSPNVSAFLSGLSSLMSTGYAGLDAPGAAALIGQADAATRRGGAYGQASLNFMYAALQRRSPGLHPLTGRALMEGGLFGTTAETFYGNNPLARYYGRNGLSRPSMSFETNFDKMLPLLEQQYGKGVYLPEAVKNLFGLQSQQQAAALMEMKDQGVLGASERLLRSRNINLSSISGSGLQSIGRIAAASSVGDLQSIYGDIMRRTDIPRGVKEKLAEDAQGAAKNGDFESMRTALIDAVGKADQEKTIATETRDAMKTVADALTKAGSPLLTVLNAIRIGGEWVVKRLGGGAAYMAQVNGYTEAAKLAEKAMANGDPGLPAPEWSKFSGSSSMPAGTMSEREAAAMKFFTDRGYSKQQAAGLVGNLVQESGLNPNAVGDKGRARGLAQWHPDRWANLQRFAKMRRLDPNAFQTQLSFIDHELRTWEEGAGVALRRSTTAAEAAKAVALNYERPQGAETGDANNIHGIGNRVGNAERLMGTPIPDGDPQAKSAAERAKLDVSFAPAHVTIDDMRRSGIAPRTVELRPVAKPRAAGATGAW